MKTPKQADYRKVRVYGEVPGTGIVFDELDDGGILSAMTATKTAQVQLNATNLMTFTRELAGVFGHVLVNPDDWRDKLHAAIEKVMAANEARCLDDDDDRHVVIVELLNALVSTPV
jgi:hypothetical protein